MSFTKQTTLSTIALALFCIGFYPAITDLVVKWSNSDEYAHAFLTVPIIGYMVWRKRELLDKTGDWSAYLGLGLLDAGHSAVPGFPAIAGAHGHLRVHAGGHRRCAGLS
jgi:hypothetical protein